MPFTALQSALLTTDMLKQSLCDYRMQHDEEQEILLLKELMQLHMLINRVCSLNSGQHVYWSCGLARLTLRIRMQKLLY